jgi:oligopeptide transport system substrate-binding protein
MKLGLAFNNAFDFTRSRQAYQEGFTLWQQTSRRPSAGLSQAPHALRVPWGEPASLDPGLATDSPSSFYIDQLFCGLVQLTAELDVVPDLASSWEVLDEGRRYRFRLRDDVYWSDGVQVTASDFAYAWRRVLAPVHKSGNAGALFTIKNGRDFHEGEVTAWDDVGVKAIDALTMEVTLENPDSTFLYLMCEHIAFAVPEHHLRKHGTSTHTAPWMAWKELVTNGPFRLVEWKPDQRLLLDSNPRYHGARSGNVESVEIRFYRFDDEDKRRLVDYEADQLDMTMPPRLHAIQARNRFAGDQLSLPQSHITYLGFDTKKAPFADPRVRRALGLAIDKERLSEVTSGGFNMPATGGLVPPGMPGHVEGIALPYDPEAARQLLAESGYGKRGAFPTLELLHAPWRTTISEYLTTQWREVLGIDIEPVQLSWPTFLEHMRTDPPAIYNIGLVPGFPDPDEFLSGDEFISQTGWRNETYKRLVQQARETMDQEARMALYRQAELILVHESPIIPLYYEQWNILVKPWVRRFPASLLKFWYWKDVVIEPH